MSDVDKVMCPIENSKIRSLLSKSFGTLNEKSFEERFWYSSR